MGPNIEQKSAIEHRGGMLLSAGAGSGKTYVLVEHMIYLLEDFFSRSEKKNLIEFELKRELSTFLSSIVMMTFTNKAAQEMQIRLEKRIQQKLDDAQNAKDKWQMVLEVLPQLNMGTIHSFCMKLIRQGHIAGVDSRASIMSQFSARALVRESCQKWLSQKQNSEFSHQVFDTLFMRFEKIIDSFCDIFLDPELRLSWENPDDDEVTIDSVVAKLFQHYNLENNLKVQEILQPYRDTTSAKWIITLDEFFTKLARFRPDTIEGVRNLQEIFSSLDRVTTPPAAKKDEQLLALFDYFKDLKAFIKDFAEELLYFDVNQDVLKNVWFPVIKELYSFIAEDWGRKDGLTFSDLEYYVYQSLKNKNVQSQISKSYRYLIVDEFQDTSEIQFKILQQIIAHDFSRIFCVGDPKQAIYGFRGGELSVFLACRQKIPQNNSLLMNYRSEEQVINFNNIFFDHLFKLGPDFEGVDKYAVKVEYQKYPHEVVPEKRGHLTRLVGNVLLKEDEDSPTRDKINQLEASLIHQYILNQVKENPLQEICILYSKLAPSKDLIDLLIKSDLSFVAQIKIPYGDDPVLGILQSLLYLLKPASRDLPSTRKMIQILLQTYLAILEIPAANNLMLAVDRFISNYQLFGPLDSFYIFLSDINLKVSDFRNVASLLEEIVKFSSDDSDLLSYVLNEERAASYSTEFRFPGKTGNLKIMTTHAAKGLEFEHVILAGIHTNAKARTDASTIGKWPYSFRWRVDNKTMRTPMMLLESRISHEKEFAEAKRLFYVACTRARKFLTWADVSVTDPAKKKSVSKYGKNWIDGLRKIHDQQIGLAHSPFNQVNNIPVSIESESQESSATRRLSPRPLFHIDSSNVFFGQIQGTTTAISSELSVTRASMLADCPMKFYLANIIKFSNEDVEYLESLIEIPNARPVESSALVSSAERGTHLHSILAKSIQSNWAMNSLEDEKISKKDMASLDWVKDLLSQHVGQNEFYSEVPVKFKFLGHMISGTPDLVILPKQESGVCEIWDFKTGAAKLEKESGYWTQLRMYAHHYFKKCRVPKIVLKLVYLDQQLIKEEEHTAASCVQKLEEIWSLKRNYLACNLQHCPHCNFGNICPSNAFSATYP